MNISETSESVNLISLTRDAAKLAQHSNEFVAKLATFLSSNLNERGKELLDVSQVLERYGMGRAALDARGVPKAKVGRAWKWLVSDIEAAIQAAPSKPRARRVVANAVNEDPIDAMVRRGELRAVHGCG
jgi:predicted DNA-binding transcriptional regulator AlpA